MSRAKDVMILIAAIQDPELPDHLQMAIANRKSVSLRFNGNHDQSDAAIQDILGRIALDSISIKVALFIWTFASFSNGKRNFAQRVWQSIVISDKLGGEEYTTFRAGATSGSIEEYCNGQVIKI